MAPCWLLAINGSGSRSNLQGRIFRRFCAFWGEGCCCGRDVGSCSPFPARRFAHGTWGAAWASTITGASVSSSIGRAVGKCAQPRCTGRETAAWNRDETHSRSPKCPRWRSPPAWASWLYAQSGKEGEGSVTDREAEPNLSPVIMFNVDFCIPLPLAWQDFGACRANGSLSHRLLTAGPSCIRLSPPSRPGSEAHTCLGGLEAERASK